jgi:hypothetical protein
MLATRYLRGSRSKAFAESSGGAAATPISFRWYPFTRGVKLRCAPDKSSFLLS